MRAIILGLPGSGTSLFAQLLVSAGWVAPPPYEGHRPYPTFESKHVRDINATMIGGRVGNYGRFRPDFEVSTPTEFAVRQAQDFILHSDAGHRKWFIKNPECTLTYPLLWKQWEWDHVIGVYRDPTANVASMRSHTKDGAEVRKQGWVLWNSIIVHNATVTARFPPTQTELANLCEKLDIVPGPGFEFDPSKMNSREGKVIPKWATKTWEMLDR